VRHGSVDERNHTLVPVVAGELRQPLVVAGVHWAACAFGQGHELAHARIAPRRREMDRAHGLGPLPQSGGHGVEAEKGTGGTR
jgi:hypothetical protein